MKEKNKNVLAIIITSVILIIIGTLGSMNASEFYNSLVLPPLAPPSWLFPVAWSIIYTLIIIAACLIEVKVKGGMLKKDAMSIYYIQFIFNILWSYIFFSFRMPLFAFIWLVILLVLVVINFIKFLRLYKVSGYLYIPYILWLLFAGYLNLSIVILN